MSAVVRFWRRSVVCLAGLVLSGIVLAEPAASPATPASSSFSSLLQVLFGLGLVLGAIAGTAWLLRRLTPGQVAASGSLRVVGGVAVGPKERVVLVDVGDTRLVLGVSPGQVTTLHQMARPEEPDSGEPPLPLQEQFTQRLKQALNRQAK